MREGFKLNLCEVKSRIFTASNKTTHNKQNFAFLAASGEAYFDKTLLTLELKT